MVTENKFLSVDQNGKVILTTNNNSEKITALENEIAALKKQVNDLMFALSAIKK